jgi:hypothetical protein
MTKRNDTLGALQAAASGNSDPDADKGSYGGVAPSNFFENVRDDEKELALARAMLAEKEAELKQLEEAQQLGASDEEIAELESNLQDAKTQIEVYKQDAIVRQEDGTYKFREFRLGATHLELTGEITIEDFIALGHALKKFGDALQFWYGDWANLFIGDETDDTKRGELYDKLADEFGLKRKSLRNYALVCRKVGVSLRKDTLHFGHHNLVTGMDVGEQISWLEKAVIGDVDENGNHQIWSVGRLRAEIKGVGDEQESDEVTAIEHRQTRLRDTVLKEAPKDRQRWLKLAKSELLRWQELVKSIEKLG